MSVSGVSTINTATVNLKAESKISAKAESTVAESAANANPKEAAKAVDSFEKS